MAEITRLTPQEEQAFQQWVRENHIADLDHPQSRYDYRGYWKQTHGASHTPGEHFPDTFKQFGHPTFSVESQYSQGPNDGGRWVGESFIPPGSGLMARSGSTPSPDLLAQALQILASRLR